MQKDEIYDITIIGGGPIGLFAGFYAGLRKAKTKIIESLPELGGQLNTLYPEKYIYDIPGFQKIKAGDLIKNLIKQLEPMKPTICLEEKVLSLTKDENNIFTLTTNKGTHQTLAVIIAAGNGAFEPRRLSVEGAEKHENKGISYFIRDMNRFKDKVVGIAGGGDSAVDWALMLEPIAKEVHLIHRRPQFRAHEHSVELLHDSSVHVLTPLVIESLDEDENGKLVGVTLKDVKSKEEHSLPLDHLIINYGFASSIDPINTWDLTFTRNNIVVHSDMSTSIAGVYAIGDINTYNGKVELIATGFGEAPTAVNNALHFIHPEQRVQPMHSSSLCE
ncbi:MAG: NAD(P)/FAD-dependent oxidoreductase [Lactobacillales bacterium]|jgi:thioredoxin reductase (NADPH)|nr:NAD(P)/FAD-dependent oxidoreductase [Lactobacillales bacterium]